MTKFTNTIKSLSVALCFSFCVMNTAARAADMSKCTYNKADDTYTCPDSNLGQVVITGQAARNAGMQGVTNGLGSQTPDQIARTASGSRAVTNEQAARANAALGGPAGVNTSGSAQPNSLNSMNVGSQAKLNALHGNLPQAGVTGGLGGPKADQIINTASGTRAATNQQINNLNAPLSGAGINVSGSAMPTQINYQAQGGLAGLQNQLNQEGKGISPAAMVGSSASSQKINMQINTDALDPGKRLYDSQQANIEKSNAAQSQAQSEIARNNQRVENMAAMTKDAEDYVQQVQQRLKNAKTPEEMAAANAELKVALQDLETAKDKQKQVEKDVKKENKEIQKNADKTSKSALKENKKMIEGLEDDKKDAEKDLKKANKKITKLEEKCAKGKCSEKDLAELSAARDAAASAQDALTIAEGKLNAATGAAYADDGADNNDVLGGMADGGASALVGSSAGGVDLSEDLAGLDAQGVADKINAPKLCQDAEGIFEVIACKAVTTLADIRVIAYIISGFGMIAFAYGAIFGKISFKQLANIGIGLFMLSMMTPFIEYFTQKPGASLKFGQYLPAGFTDVGGSSLNQQPCTVDSRTGDLSGNCPEVEVYGVDQSYKKEKWSLKDLKGSIQAGLTAVRSASNMYNAAKTTITNTKNQINNMKAAIKTGGGGLDGIINGVNAVANAGAGIANSGKLLANNLAANSSTLSNSLKDAASTNAAREKRAEIQSKSDALTKKCNAGNCSDNEKRQLEVYNEYLEQEKTSVDKWMQNDGAGGGATILAGINKVNDLSAKVASSTHVAANAAHEGQTIGGGGAFGTLLGAAMGAGTAYVEGSNLAESGSFNFDSAAKTRQKQQEAEQAAFEKTAGHIKSTQEDDKKKVETRGDGSIKTTNKQTGMVTIVNADGSIEATSPDGSKIVKKTDGTQIKTNSNGLVVTYDKDGKEISRDTSGVKVKFNSADSTSVSNSLAGKGTAAAPAGSAPAAEEKKEENKREVSSTTASDSAKVTDKGKEQRKAACSAYSGDAKASCETCAAKDTEGEYRSCLEKMNKEQKAKAEAEAKAKAEAEKKQTPQTNQSSQANSCPKNLKADCFMGGADAATCKKCGFETPDSLKAKKEAEEAAAKKAAEKHQAEVAAAVIGQCESVCSSSGLPRDNIKEYVAQCKSSCKNAKNVSEAATCIKGIQSKCETYKRQLDRGI